MARKFAHLKGRNCRAATLRQVDGLQWNDLLDWYETVFELIDMRSFSNLWFWIALAVLWSSTSHWVLGVPWDVVIRARKAKGPQDAQSVIDLHDLVRINANRILYIAKESGLLLAGFVCFCITVSFLLGFVYHKEFAQALFLLGFPMSFVGLLSFRTARKIKMRALEGDALYRQLYRHRLVTQVIGMISIFATAMWGMLQNMTIGVLGG